jgi:hypothetical protein
MAAVSPRILVALVCFCDILRAASVSVFCDLGCFGRCCAVGASKYSRRGAKAAGTGRAWTCGAGTETARKRPLVAAAGSP